MAPSPVPEPRALFGQPARVVGVRGIVSDARRGVRVEGHGLFVAPLRSPAGLACCARRSGSEDVWWVALFLRSAKLPAVAPVRRSSDMT